MANNVMLGITLLTVLENDIALLELKNTLAFNKWVQPICLPTSESIGDSADRGWILGPLNSICKIVRKFKNFNLVSRL